MRRHGLRRAFRITALLAAGTLLLLLLLAVAGLWYARSAGGRERLRQLIVSSVRQSVPGFQLGAIRGDYLRSLVLDKISLRDRHGGEAIEVDTVRLRYDLTALLQRRLRIMRVTIEGPRVWLRTLRGGSTNLAQLLVPSPAQQPEATQPTEPMSWSVGLGELRLERGSFVDLRAANGTTVERLSLNASGLLKKGNLRVAVEHLRARAHVAGQPALDIELVSQVRLNQWNRLEKGHLELQIGGPPSGKAELELSAAGPLEQLQLDVDVKLGKAGSAKLDGWIDAASKQLRYQLQLSLQQLRPDLLVSTLPEMRLDARIEGRGEGLPLQTSSTLALGLALTDSAVAGIALDTVDLAGRATGSNWTVERLDLRSRGSRLQASGSGTLQHVDAQLRIRAPDLARLPIAALQPGQRRVQLAGSLDLEATVAGQFDGELKARISGSAHSLRIMDARIDRISLDAALRGLPASPRGKLTLSAKNASWRDPALRIETLDGTFDGGLRGGQAEVSLRGLGGTTHAALLWRDRGPSRARFEATVQGVVPPGLPRISGRIVAQAKGRSLRTSVTARFAGRPSRLQASANLPITYPTGAFVPTLKRRRSASVKLELKDLELELLRQLGLSATDVAGHLTIRAQLDGPLTGPRLSAKLSLREGRVGSVDGLAAQASLALADDLVLDVEATQKGAPLARLHGSLAITSAQALRLGKDPLQRLGRAPLRLRFASGKIALAHLAQLDPAFARLAGLARVQLKVDGQPLRPRADLELAVDNGRIGRRELGAIRLAVRLRGDEEASPTSADLELDVDGQPLLRGHGSVGQTVASLVRAPEHVRTAPLRGELEIKPTPLARARRFHELLAQVNSGSIGGRATIAGTLARPRLKAKVRLDDLRVAHGSVESMSIEANATADSVIGQLALRQRHGGALSARARLMLGLPTPTIDGELRGKDLDIGFVSALVPELQRTAGRLALTAKVEGQLSQPSIQAQLQLSDGRLRARGMSELKGITLRATLDSRSARVERLVVGSGAGQLVASGHAELRQFRPQAFELTARAQKFRLGVAPVNDAIFDGRVLISGKRERSTLKIRVTVTDGAVQIPKIASQRSLHATGELPDILYVDQAARAKRAQRKRKLARNKAARQVLELHTRADSLMVRGEDLDVELAIDLRITAAAGGAPEIRGSVQIRRGQVAILGNRYTVDRAIVRLSGGKDPDPAIDVRLRRDFAEGTVFITLRGTLSDSELVLSSQPANYDQSQLLSLVLTGRLDPRAGDQGGDQAMAVASAVAQAVFGLLAKQVASRVGIDVTRIGVSQTQDDKTGEARIRAEAEIGKFITRRLYVAYRRVFGADETENANEALGEYRISARWLLMALFGDRGVGNLDLAWTYRY